MKIKNYVNKENLATPIIILIIVLLIFYYNNKLSINKKLEKKKIEKILSLEEKAVGIEIRYYQKKDFKQLLKKQEATKSLEYFEAWINTKTNLPIKENHFKEYKLFQYRTFEYDKKKRVKNIMVYSKNHNPLSEEIYQYNKNLNGEYETDKITFYYSYFNSKSSTPILKSKKRYRNGKKDGIWVYFNKSGETEKEVFYKNDKEIKSWAKGKILKE